MRVPSYCRSALAAVALLLATSSLSLAEQIKVVCWNLESGESSSAHLAKQMEGLAQIDLWGLSEVDPKAATLFAKACAKGSPGHAFDSIVRHEVAVVAVLRSEERPTAPAVLPAVSNRDVRPW
jgi:hypothetical protein